MSPFSCPHTRYLPSLEMQIAVIGPYFLLSAVPRICFPLLPTSKRTTLPKDVPIARYLMLFDVMTVGMPTPLEVWSKAAVTLFSTMKAMFLIYDRGGTGVF